MAALTADVEVSVAVLDMLTDEERRAVLSGPLLDETDNVAALVLLVDAADSDKFPILACQTHFPAKFSP